MADAASPQAWLYDEELTGPGQGETAPPCQVELGHSCIVFVLTVKKTEVIAHWFHPTNYIKLGRLLCPLMVQYEV